MILEAPLQPGSTVYDVDNWKFRYRTAWVPSFIGVQFSEGTYRVQYHVPSVERTAHDCANSWCQSTVCVVVVRCGSMQTCPHLPATGKRHPEADQSMHERELTRQQQCLIPPSSPFHPGPPSSFPLTSAYHQTLHAAADKFLGVASSTGHKGRPCCAFWRDQGSATAILHGHARSRTSAALPACLLVCLP